MADLEKITSWIEGGKQIGKVFSFENSGKIFWSSVGIQKWQNSYKVYVDEIDETKMSAEDYERDEIRKFNTLSDALEFIKNYTKADINDLSPCKGQKIFNPKFE